MSSVYLALDALFTRYLNLFQQETGQLPTVCFDPPWPSPCIQTGSDQDDNSQYWRPVPRAADDNPFKDLEKALEFPFHEDFVVYYTSFWSNGICVDHKGKHLKLIQIWNDEDEKQLKENILGHVFAKLKNRLKLTLFIGCTDGDEVIVLDQESGAVLLERPGKAPHETLADNLEQFLIGAIPDLTPYD